jgi:lysophospholipase L1-like esterase
VMMIGANDVTALNGISQSAHRLGAAVRKLRTHGTVVIVGTCPDLGVITAIPQPLRSLAHARTSQLARAQAAAVRAAGGVPVPLAHLLAPQFRATPELMFSPDGFHPSPAAYALAARALLVELCDELGEKVDSPEPGPPAPPATAVLDTAHTRHSVMPRIWQRPVPGSPAPSS